MTKHEFMFEHDLEQVIDLIERYAKWHGMIDGDTSRPTTDNVKVISPDGARDFFAI